MEKRGIIDSFISKSAIGEITRGLNMNLPSICLEKSELNKLKYLGE